MTLWYQCYHCWCCTLMISCISMRAAAITPGSGSLREALNSACRWETVVGEMSWKWCIANSAFLRTSSLCEQWLWYYHHWSAKIANYQYQSPLVNVNWSHWSISITTNLYWSLLIGINHHLIIIDRYQSPLIYTDHHWSNVDHYWSLTWDVSSCLVPMAAMLVSSQLLSAYTLSLEPLTPQVYWSWSCSIIVYTVGTTIHSLERTKYIQCIHCENKALFWTC